MKRLAALAIAATVLIVLATDTPSAAAGGGPSIPAGAFGGEGVTGPSGEPSSQTRWVALPGGDGSTTVAQIAVEGGEVERWRGLEGDWALPAVTQLGTAAGVSADGGTLVLIRSQYGRRAPTTTDFLVLEPDRRLKPRTEISLDGSFSFDAISPDGRLAYVVEYEDPRDPLDYRVRVLDLVSGELRPGEVVDPETPDERMAGIPLSRGAGSDGRWAYTLYSGGEETFIHALDTVDATAVCVDLPQFDPGGNFFNLGLEVDSTTGAITVLKRGQPKALVDPLSFEVKPAAALPIEESADESTVTGSDGDPLAWALVALGAGLLGAVALAVTITRRRRARQIFHDELERA